MDVVRDIVARVEGDVIVAREALAAFARRTSRLDSAA